MAAALIVNGSFEQPAVSGSFATYAAGATQIPGWRITKGTVDVIGPQWHPAAGRQSLDLDGTPGPGSIVQTIHTIPGRMYTLRFALAGNPECAPSLKRLRVAVGRVVRTYTFDASHTSDAAMGWKSEQIPFAAAGPATTVSFASLDTGGSNCGPALDAISVTAGSTRAPAPAANWSGMWTGNGYYCVGGPLPAERIRITQRGNSLVAVKVTGDRCVPAGNVTWQATISGSRLQGRGQGAQPGQSLQSVPITGQLRNADTIAIYWGGGGQPPLVFTRNGGASVPSPAPPSGPAPKPCYVNSYAFAKIGPCFGPIGTRLAVTLLRAMKSPPAKLRFDRVLVNGVPAVVMQVLTGSGTSAGSVYTASADKKLCAGPGFPKTWTVTLVDANGKRQGQIGSFTITGCP